MAIGNDRELVTAAAQASKLIQNIQDYRGRELGDDSKQSRYSCGCFLLDHACAKALHFPHGDWLLRHEIAAIVVLRTDVLERVVLQPVADLLWMKPPQRALSEFTITIG